MSERMYSVRLSAADWQEVVDMLGDNDGATATALVHKITLALQAAAVDATIAPPDDRWKVIAQQGEEIHRLKVALGDVAFGAVTLEEAKDIAARALAEPEATP